MCHSDRLYAAAMQTSESARHQLKSEPTCIQLFCNLVLAKYEARSKMAAINHVPYRYTRLIVCFNIIKLLNSKGAVVVFTLVSLTCGVSCFHTGPETCWEGLETW